MLKRRGIVIFGAVFALALGAAATVRSADSDCSMCHDTAPVPADHMPVDEVSSESCMMCHETSGGDPFFRVLHEKHGDSLGCDSCHSDASAEQAAKLKELLGK